MRGVLTKMVCSLLPVAWLLCQGSFTAAITIEFEVPGVHWFAPNEFNEWRPPYGPYVEQGIRFQDPLGGTSHVSYHDDAIPGSGCLALGDWNTHGVSRSQIRVDHVDGWLFTLKSLDYYFGWQPGSQMILESSKGGKRSLPGDGSHVSLVGDPDWQGISWFTIAGSGGTGLVEASIDNVKIVTNLVLVTHGWNSHAGAWAKGMADSIQSQLISAGHQADRLDWSENDDFLSHSDSGPEWEVATYDWQRHASTWSGLWPVGAAENALKLGKEFLGPQIKEFGYDSVHLIAHSAGAWMIDAIADALEDSGTDVHLTFLDAFVPLRWLGYKKEHLGDTATWAEHYVNRPDAPGTDWPLLECFNLDVTSLDEHGEGHSWPWQWYKGTTEWPERPDAHQWGFLKTLEYSGAHPSFNNEWKKGDLMDLAATGDIDNCRNWKLVISDTESHLDLANAAVSDTGEVLLEEAAFTLTTGSSVWIEVPLQVREPANLMRFGYEFLSDAEGALIAYLDDVPIMGLDEALSAEGNTDWFWLAAEIGPGTYDMRFVLDPRAGAPSSVRISAVRTGFAHMLMVPEPGTLWLMLAGALALAARHRRGFPVLGRLFISVCQWLT